MNYTIEDVNRLRIKIPCEWSEQERRVNACLVIVEETVEKHGGELMTGWLVKNDELIDYAITLIHHCVWSRPTGELVDIAPQLSNLADGTPCVKVPNFIDFIPDPDAKFRDTKPHRWSLPSRIVPTKKDKWAIEGCQYWQRAEDCDDMRDPSNRPQADYWLNKANKIFRKHADAGPMSTSELTRLESGKEYNVPVFSRA